MRGRVVSRRVLRRAFLATWLILMASAALPSVAEGQGLFFWRKKKPAPAAPANAPAAATSAPLAAPAPQAATPPAQAPPPAADPAAMRQADYDRAVQDARARDLTREVTVQNAEDRMRAWSLVLAIERSDPDGVKGFEQARRDLVQARSRAADSATNQAMRAELRSADAALKNGDLQGAEAIADRVLAVNRDDPQANSIKQSVAAERERKKAKRFGFAAGGGLLASALVVGALARRAIAAQRARQATAATRPVLIQVVDGVGRGRMLTLQGDVCRIGAVETDAPTEKNDFVISDSGALISRHHCTIVRKNGDYYLLDSSLNGTRVNDETLERGEHHRLRDGDEIVIADASRLKFLVT